MRRLIVPITSLLLLAALAAAIVDYWQSPGFGPAATALTVTAAILGLFIDRWLSERERRRQFLRALVHELYMNLAVLKEVSEIASRVPTDAPTMLPRFYDTSLAAVISSGVFAGDADAELWRRMHSWLQRSGEANARFVVAERYTIEHPEAAQAFREVMRDGEVIRCVRESLVNLTSCLVDKYADESGIDRETTLFATPSAAGDAEQALPADSGSR